MAPVSGCADGRGKGTVAGNGNGNSKGKGKATGRPVALVYRGPESLAGCPEAAARLVESAPRPFRAVFCGPDEDTALTPETLRTAALYVQPGGGDLDPAWRAMRRYAADIRGFVRGGGGYLGICLGGYLAGNAPGFGLLAHDTDEYTARPHAAVRDTDDTVVKVRWRGRNRTMYFQDGPYFVPGPGDQVLATYDDVDGDVCAAMVARFGAGRVGVVGPHPEADRGWYEDQGLTNPDGIRFDLGYDLLRTTVPG
ncbi:MAG: hypothetical protein HOY79_02570 [Streptomyces sp.]|nr:hypothetical protein [Streptomyces sp.]